MVDYWGILIFLVAAVAFVVGGLFISFLLRPDRPNEEKLTTYESGEDTVGSAWGNFNVRFYLVALIFIMFEAEIIFLFPWATVFANKQLILQTEGLWAWMAFIEMLVFMGLLALGLAYVWKKGYLDWDKEEKATDQFKNHIPEDLYQKLNQKYK